MNDRRNAAYRDTLEVCLMKAANNLQEEMDYYDGAVEHGVTGEALKIIENRIDRLAVEYDRMHDALIAYDNPA
jgi:hypothetical protein